MNILLRRNTISTNKKNNKNALELIAMAIDLNAPNPAPWMLKSQILADNNEYKKAIGNAKKALKVAESHNFWYEIEENEAQIKKRKLLLNEKK